MNSLLTRATAILFRLREAEKPKHQGSMFHLARCLHKTIKVALSGARSVLLNEKATHSRHIASYHIASRCVEGAASARTVPFLFGSRSSPKSSFPVTSSAIVLHVIIRRLRNSKLGSRLEIQRKIFLLSQSFIKISTRFVRTSSSSCTQYFEVLLLLMQIALKISIN